MKNKTFKYYAMIFIFLGVSIVFYAKSLSTFSEFLIFLFCGILIGINIFKLKNIEK